MRRTRRLAKGIALAALVAGCGTSHPLGIDDATWQEMSKDERLQAYEKAAEQRRARDTATDETSDPPENTDTAREQWWGKAMEGDDGGADTVVRLVPDAPGSRRASQVVIEGGKVNVPVGGGLSFSDAWRPHDRTSFAILEGESKRVSLCRKRKSGCVEVHVLRHQGQTCFAERPFPDGVDPTTSGRTGHCLPPRGKGRLTLGDTLLNAKVRIRPFNP